MRPIVRVTSFALALHMYIPSLAAGRRYNADLSIFSLKSGAIEGGTTTERIQAQTDFAARQNALRLFSENVTLEPSQRSRSRSPRAAAEWEYGRVKGRVPLSCGDEVYYGPVDGIGFGSYGVTVSLHRGSEDGNKVIAKVGKKWIRGLNMEDECNIFKRLQNHDPPVPNTLICHAYCQQNGYPIIILTPFMEGEVKTFKYQVDPAYFNASADAAFIAVRETLRTGFLMLEAGVTDHDRALNILYKRDGSVLFIDMGLAYDLVTDNRDTADGHRRDAVQIFVDILLAKVPVTWWQDGTAAAILSSLTMPKTPAYLESAMRLARKKSLEELIAGKIATKMGA